MVRLVESKGEIPRFYAGRSVFITGATGFMGKVFDVLRQTNPRQLDKLVFIPGDTMKQDLGMSQESIAMMQEVSVVFDIAATVKFNEKLSRAIEQNVRSVLRAMDVCDKLNNLQAFVYVSTAYSNAELYRVEERVYPPPVHPKQLLERDDEMLRDDTTSQSISPKPNTYTFSKAIAEYMVEQRVSRYATAIFRPTIVVSSLRHPFPGWVDNLNGPTGVIAGVGKGLMRVIRTRGEARADLLPVDIAIDTLIAIAWETSVDKLPAVRVYNCTTGENPITWTTMKLKINKYLKVYPLDNALWYPHIRSIENKYIHKTMVFILQTIPSYFIEYSSRLFLSKSHHNLMSAYQKIKLMDEVLSVFTLNEWHFLNENVVRLRNRLSMGDAAVYNLDPKTIVWDDHLRDFVIGTRKYVLKERDEHLPAARRRMRVLSSLYYGLILLTVLFVVQFFMLSSSVFE